MRRVGAAGPSQWTRCVALRFRSRWGHESWGFAASAFRRATVPWRGPAPAPDACRSRFPLSANRGSPCGDFMSKVVEGRRRARCSFGAANGSGGLVLAVGARGADLASSIASPGPCCGRDSGVGSACARRGGRLDRCRWPCGDAFAALGRGSGASIFSSTTLGRARGSGPASSTCREEETWRFVIEISLADDDARDPARGRGDAGAPERPHREHVDRVGLLRRRRVRGLRGGEDGRRRLHALARARARAVPR